MYKCLNLYTLGWGPHVSDKASNNKRCRHQPRGPRVSPREGKRERSLSCGAVLRSPRRRRAPCLLRPIAAAAAAATRARSSRRRWCCGRCRWGSRSARAGGGAGARGRRVCLLPGRQRRRARRRLPRPALRQHRRFAPALLAHVGLRSGLSLTPQTPHFWFRGFPYSRA